MGNTQAQDSFCSRIKSKVKAKFTVSLSPPRLLIQEYNTWFKCYWQREKKWADCVFFFPTKKSTSCRKSFIGALDCFSIWSRHQIFILFASALEFHCCRQNTQFPTKKQKYKQKLPLFSLKKSSLLNRYSQNRLTGWSKHGTVTSTLHVKEGCCIIPVLSCPFFVISSCRL